MFHWCKTTYDENARVSPGIFVSDVDNVGLYMGQLWTESSPDFGDPGIFARLTADAQVGSIRIRKARAL